MKADRSHVAPKPGLERMRAALTLALEELTRIADNQARYSEEELVDVARVDLSVIAELEIARGEAQA